jgi:hypothetical protein
MTSSLSLWHANWPASRLPVVAALRLPPGSAGLSHLTPSITVTIVTTAELWFEDKFSMVCFARYQLSVKIHDIRRLHSAQRRTHSEAVSATFGRTFYGQSSAVTRSALCKAGAFWARSSHDDCPVDEGGTAISLPQYSRWSISLPYRTSAC